MQLWPACGGPGIPYGIWYGIWYGISHGILQGISHGIWDGKLYGFFKDSVWNFVRYDSFLFFKFFGAGASGFFVLFCIFHTMPVWNLWFLLCVLVASFFPYIFSMCFFLLAGRSFCCAPREPHGQGFSIDSRSGFSACQSQSACRAHGVSWALQRDLYPWPRGFSCVFILKFLGYSDLGSFFAPKASRVLIGQNASASNEEVGLPTCKIHSFEKNHDTFFGVPLAPPAVTDE